MRFFVTIFLTIFFSGFELDKKIDSASNFLLNEVLTTYDSASVFTVSIAAPEVIRYHELSNLMEVQALRLMYAELGSDEVDFSVGFFQMKPSFIEELEDRLSQNLELSKKYSLLLQFQATKLSEIRQERIDRILNPGFSQVYLNAFVDLMQKEHEQLFSCLQIKEQLQFLATAYNMGFGFNTQSILNYQRKQHFPYGSSFKGEQYAFGKLSVKIFDHLNNLLCASNL